MQLNMCWFCFFSVLLFSLTLTTSLVMYMCMHLQLQKRTTGKMKSSDEEFADMNRQTLIEMKNQAKLWDRIDNMMEDKLKILKATGEIFCFIILSL